MAKTAEFKIVINGIQESISAVEALNENLKTLESRINALQGKAVNIKQQTTTTTTSDQSADAAHLAALKEEDRVIEQIYQTEAKINVARGADYQHLVQEKELLKEITNETKSRAAEERLVGKEYENTMAGLKQELRDIKQVMQTMDLGDEKFGELVQRANELNTKLKGIEQSYGQFGRNVGNYANGVAEGMNGVQVQVGDTVMTFNSAKEAARELGNELKNMAVNGQRGTKEYEELDEAVRKLDSDLKDIKTSSQAMDNLLDTMQGVIAIASTAKGIGALFGFDSNEIEQSIQKLVALQNVLQGIEKISQQMKTGEGIGGMFAKANTAVDNFAASLLKVDKSAAGASKSVKALSTAMKALGGVAIAAAIIAITAAISKLNEKNEELRKTQEKNNEVLKASEGAYIKAKIEMDGFIKKINQFNGTAKEEKKLLDEVNTKYGTHYKHLSDAKNAKTGLNAIAPVYLENIRLEAEMYALAAQKAEDYVDAILLTQKQKELQGWLSGRTTWTIDAETLTGHTYEQQERALEQVNKQLAENKKRQDAVNEAMQKNSEKAAENAKKMKELGVTGKETTTNLKKGYSDVEKTINDLQMRLMDEGLNKRLRQLDEEKRQTLNKLKQNSRAYLEVERLYQELRLKEVKNYLKELEKSIQESADRIKNERLTLDVSKIEEIIKELDREFEEFQKQEMPRFQPLVSSTDYDEMLRFFGVTEERIEQLKEKYKELEELKNKHQEEIELPNGEKITATVQNVGFEDMEAQIREEFAKELNLIENYQILEQQSLSESFKKRYSETEAYYGKNLDGLQNYLISRSEALKKQANKEKEIAEDAASRAYENQKETLEKQSQTLQKEIYKITKKYGGDLSKMSDEDKKVYDKMQANLSDVLGQINDEWENYVNKVGRKRAYEKELEKAEKGMLAIAEKYGDDLSKMSDEDKEAYDKMQAKHTNALEQMKNGWDIYTTDVQQALNKVGIIELQHSNRLAEIDKEMYEKMNSESEKYFNTQISNFREFNSKMSNELSKTPTYDKYGFGIMNLGTTKKQYKEIQDAAKQTITNILAEKRKLDDAFTNGFIDNETYNASLEQLNDVEKSATDSLNAVGEKIKDIPKDFWEGINVWIQQIGQAMGSVLGSLSEIQSNQYDKMIDEQEKYIDKYSDLLDKQRDKTQEYADAVKNIEDELSTARGDRRQQLIDNLNAEMAAQRASLAQEKKIEKEKEKAEEKKKKLEVEQAKAKKKMDLAQAAINAAMAISMAAVNHWPVPAVPMMAMAAAVGAAQIAAVKSQNIPSYGEGGVIEGKSHRQGGVKAVVGNSPIELEGNEFIIRKSTATQNINLLDYINRSERKLSLEDFIDFYSSNKVRSNVQRVKSKFADGGSIPTLRNDIDLSDRMLTAFEDYSNRPVQVAVVDIQNATDRVNQVRVLSGLEG